MIEDAVNRGTRIDLARKTSAMYPESARLYWESNFERAFLSKCLSAGKILTIQSYGLPDHGGLVWTYGGDSKFFTISQASDTPTIAEAVYTPIDTLLTSLRKNVVALLTPEDIQNANKIAAIPRSFRNKLSELDSLVAKDKRNGIILVSP